MTVDIEQIFTAKPESVGRFLAANGQGCYIPAYQRPYAWDKGNVERLFDDVLNGLDHLLKRSGTISFLGTIIAIHDTTYVTVKPVFQAEVANKVMTLIDGQQRISTSMMINIALHHQIGLLAKRSDKVADEVFAWIREQAVRAQADLKNTFALDQAQGTPPANRFYPRIIRAFDDVWSTKGSQAVYSSPIARLIWAYISHIETQSTEPFKYTAFDASGNAEPRHNSIVAVFKHIQDQLTALANKKAYIDDFPDIQQAVQNDEFMKGLWSFPAPDPIKKFITERSDHKQYALFCSLYRALIFFKYFNTRMALTIVTTRCEDDAFDMFEALNTTGEPLTAFETFKPKIIEEETLANYQQSPSFGAVSKIEEYLDTFKKAEDRQKAASELLIPFALGETGDKLQKNLNDQRRYLRDYFDNIPSLDEKRAVVRSLANLSSFVRTGWQTSGPVDLEVMGALDDEASFAFSALQALKHNIVIAPLSRFYGEYQLATDGARAEKKNEFMSAVKACTAFSMLWRGAFGGTENIDTIYRNIMSAGNASSAILPIGRRTKAGLGVVSLNNLKRMLWAKLTEKFPDRAAWIAAASNVPIYGHSTVVAKFLLLAASDDAAQDPNDQALIVRGKKGYSPTIKPDLWAADCHFSVEHIAPQSRPPSGWDAQLYNNPQTINVLGNLTLLPEAANNYVGGRPWVHKRLIYRYFSSETDVQAQSIFASFAKAGLSVSASGNAVLGKTNYMHLCKSLGSCNEDWSTDVVGRRSVRLSELAFDRIVDWVKP